MVEAARTGPRPGGEEVLQQCRRELVEPTDPSLLGEAHQQPQLALLAVVLASKGPLWVRKRPTTAAMLSAHAEHLLAVAQGDLPERRDRHLRVDLRRGGLAVPDEIPDRLQAEVGIHQPLDAGVSQGVRARPGNLDPGAQQVVLAHAEIAAADGRTGATVRMKTWRSGVGRPAVTEVVDDGFPDWRR